MEAEPKFRTAAVGYNKNDVNDYIEQMTQEYQDKIKEKDDEIAKLRNQLKELKAQVEENTKTALDIKEKDDEIGKLKNQLKELKMQAEEGVKAANSVKEKEQEITNLRSRLEELQSEVEKNKDNYDSSEDKAKIAEVLIKAQATAEGIIEEAKATAAEERRRIEEVIEKDRENIVDMKGELKKLRTTVIEMLKHFEKDLNSYIKDDDKEES